MESMSTTGKLQFNEKSAANWRTAENFQRCASFLCKKASEMKLFGYDGYAILSKEDSAAKEAAEDGRGSRAREKTVVPRSEKR